MLRRCFSSTVIIIFLLLQSISAAGAEIENISSAFSALYKGVFSSVASYAAVPRISLPGVSIEEKSSNNLTYRLSFNRSDLSTYLSAFNPASVSWYEKLIYKAGSTISPLTPVAINLLSQDPYEKGEVILDGVILTEIISTGSSIKNWFDLLVVKDFSRVEFSVKVSVVVSGFISHKPLAFEGLLHGKGESDGSSITITTEHMSCNGKEIVILPIVFKTVEKEKESENSRENLQVS